METPSTSPNQDKSGSSVIPLGQFELDLGTRALLKDGHEVRLSSRAFDILTTIVLAGGRIVTKDELLETVWPGLYVEESNIHVHVSAVRKALSDQRQLINTVPGRGYRFVARERDLGQARSCGRTGDRAPAAETAGASSSMRPLPRRRPLFGRDAALGEIENKFELSRVLTLTGPGGVGKTSLGIEFAHRIASDPSRAVIYLDLAECDSASAISQALSAKVVPQGSGKSDPSQQPALPARIRTLLVIDNAEHVIDEVARFVEQLTGEHEFLYVLVTSRERLRIATETVFRVEPLALPPPGKSIDVISQSPAVNLFIKCATLRGVHIGNDDEIRVVAEICHRLDGLPLAIELAVGRASVFGLEGVRERLEERFLFLDEGYRTAQPRHRTLLASLEWSVSRLSPSERAVFLRVALFTGFFTMDAAFAVACDDKIDRMSALDGVAQLVEKSLLDVSVAGVIAKYRLSESARAYALQELECIGELQSVAKRHAQYVCTVTTKRSVEYAVADAGSGPK
jgi:predicted ATPase/DNA-binding winged helix-turn-helix (wHTH) protein